MNIVGQFGQFIIKYQDSIEIALISAVVIIAAVFVVRGIINGKKKRELLTEINNTVTQISRTVTDMSSQKQDSKSDMIYIDNRSAGGKCSEEAAVQTEKTDDAAAALEPVQEITVTSESENQPESGDCTSSESEPSDTGRESDVTEENASGLAKIIGKEKKEQDADLQEPAEKTEASDNDVPRKFFSRDCAVSKSGRVYTEEELEKQIR